MRTNVQYIVARGKTEHSRRIVTIDGTKIVEARDTSVGGGADDPECAIVFTLTPALADAVRDGSLDISVGFMRGEIKMSGDSAVLFEILPVLRRAHGFA